MFWKSSETSTSSKLEALRDMLRTHDELLRETWPGWGRPYPSEQLLERLERRAPRVAAAVLSAARHLTASNTEARELALDVLRSTEAALVHPTPPVHAGTPSAKLVQQIVARHGEALAAVHRRWLRACAERRYDVGEEARVWHRTKGVSLDLVERDVDYMVQRLPESVRHDVAGRSSDPKGALRAALSIVNTNFVLSAPATMPPEKATS